MSQLKAGDLALVIKANNPENIGRVAELIRFDDSILIDHAPYGPGRTANKDRMPCFVVRGEFVVTGLLGQKETTEVAAIPAAWLMPLRGDFTPERKKDVEVPA